MIAPLLLPVVLALGAAPPPRFSLHDQFERPHTQATVFGAGPVVMVGGDERGTREAMVLWVRALRGPLGGDAALWGLADLDGVPFFVPNSTVRKGLRRELPRTPVLCDWDGEVYPRLGFSEDTVTEVRVFDAAGEAVGTVTGPPTAERVRAVLTQVARARRGAGPASPPPPRRAPAPPTPGG